MSDPDQIEVHLKTGDDRSFVVLKKDIAPCSQTIRDLIEQVGTTSAEDPIPLPNVSSKILVKIVEYCKEHTNDPAPAKMPTEDEKKQQHITSSEPVKETTFDEEFMRDLDQDTVFDLVLVANYLDIRSLLELCARTISKWVIGKTPAEVFALFGVEPVEITAEMEKDIITENPWLEETK